MGKRSDFERAPRDFYPTPREAVIPLLPHLPKSFSFMEPCAGDGALIDHIEALSRGACYSAYDIDPQSEDIQVGNALEIQQCNMDLIITNPPWDRKVLHPLITHLSDLAPTWLLFDADWVHTRQSAPFLARLRRIVSVGRVKWIPDSKMTGKDNCCWYLFGKPSDEVAVFYGRSL